MPRLRRELPSPNLPQVCACTRFLPAVAPAFSTGDPSTGAGDVPHGEGSVCAVRDGAAPGLGLSFPQLTGLSSQSPLSKERCWGPVPPPASLGALGGQGMPRQRWWQVCGVLRQRPALDPALPWLWVGKGGRGGPLENRITVKGGRFLQVTCELLPPIPDPGRNFKSPPGSALATGSGGMRARGIFLLGLLALGAELQAAPTAGEYRRVGAPRGGLGALSGFPQSRGWFGLRGPSGHPQPSPAAQRAGTPGGRAVLTVRDADFITLRSGRAPAATELSVPAHGRGVLGGVCHRTGDQGGGRWKHPPGQSPRLGWAGPDLDGAAWWRDGAVGAEQLPSAGWAPLGRGAPPHSPARGVPRKLQVRAGLQRRALLPTPSTCPGAALPVTLGAASAALWRPGPRRPLPVASGAAWSLRSARRQPQLLCRGSHRMPGPSPADENVPAERPSLSKPPGTPPLLSVHGQF